MSSTRLDGTLVIEHELTVATTVAARVVCGVRGQILRRIGENIEHHLQEMWGLDRVELRLWVKARKTR